MVIEIHFLDYHRWITFNLGKQKLNTLKVIPNRFLIYFKFDFYSFEGLYYKG